MKVWFLMAVTGASLLQGEAGPSGADKLPAHIDITTETVVFDIAPTTGFAVPIVLGAQGGRALSVSSKVGPTVTLAGMTNEALVSSSIVDLVGNGTGAGRIPEPFENTFPTYLNASAVRLPMAIIGVTGSVVICGPNKIQVTSTCSTSPNCYLARQYLIPHDPDSGDAVCSAIAMDAGTCITLAQAICIEAYH